MPGRKPLSELESLRRKALRMTIALKALKDELKELGDNLDEIWALDSPGRRPLSRKQVVQREQGYLNEVLASIAKIEAETGEEHLPIRKVIDPVVHNNTVNKIGRKENSEIDNLDKLLQLECEKVPLTLADFKKNKSYDVWEAEVTISEKGKRMGRLPKLFSVRFSEHKSIITDLVARVEKLESKLSSVEKFERQLTLYRDFERIKRKRIKKNINTSKYADYTAEIEHMVAIKKGLVEYSKAEATEIFHPFGNEINSLLDEIDAIKIKHR
jgi:chaperonin cofactor prefoldin